ncbi:MAG: hypothetical protein R2856_32035 [Caldilineaceae bacterium]
MRAFGIPEAELPKISSQDSTAPTAAAPQHRGRGHRPFTTNVIARSAHRGRNLGAQ